MCLCDYPFFSPHTHSTKNIPNKQSKKIEIDGLSCGAPKHQYQLIQPQTAPHNVNQP